MQIYLVVNKVNGKRYIGQTVQTLKKRWSSHGSDAKRGRGPHALVHALLKYGKENFSIRTLKVCSTRKQLNTLERAFIVKLKTKAPNGYNITDGGDGTVGVTWTAIQRARWIKATQGKRKGINNSFFGMKHTAATKKKMRLAKLGKPRAPGTWMEPFNWKHGTSYGYKKEKCRCKKCRKYRHDLHVRTGN